MKALSIQQPWAWLIVNGHKSIENRKWDTRFRGTFLVHTGKKVDKEAYYWLEECMPEIYAKTPFADEIQVGGIVGQSRLINTVQEKDRHLLTERDKPWFFGKLGFVLDNSKPLPFTPYKGQLGFFDINYNDYRKEDGC
jgi:hypothetical protein